MAAVPAVAFATAVPAGIAAAATNASHPASGAQHDYIVILRNQNSTLGVRSAARHTAVQSEQKPVVNQLHSAGGSELGSTSLVNAVVAKTTAASAQSLAANPAVAEVVPNQVIPGPVVPAETFTGPSTSPASGQSSPAISSRLCSSQQHPQLNPEALFNIHSVEANQIGATGAGVTVALIADGLNPANPDFQRNAQFASKGSPAGSPVVNEVDFSTDGVNAPTTGGEAFLDASSIAAQGNATYNLNSALSPGNQIPGGCFIKIRGVAPGANVLAEKVFSENNDTTTSAFLQAINFAVANGTKVINESFGNNGVPDLAADVIRQADDAAVKAGVTVVVSSGDAGSTSTIGSPATDPNVISVGATTTFRSYAQANFGGFRVPGANGKFVDNNLADLSSGGFSEAGNTLDLVAPGDSNWALCDANTKMFSDCVNLSDTAGAPIEFTGGTSESSPLTAGAAADVIQAYAAAHHGTDPTPALVKKILMSTATDIDAPATQQGAGLLNVEAAVKLARTIKVPSSSGGLLVNTSQVNVSQPSGATTTKTVSVTNTSSRTERVLLSTRALSKSVFTARGHFTLDPSSASANTGVFPIWSDVKEVFDKVPFHVARVSGTSRLDFSFDYQFTGQTSLLHVALLEPNGTYAAYSDPQGLADFGDIQVTNPPAGKWTAVFFTELNGATAGGVGTSGPVQWSANTEKFTPASSISPSTLFVRPGKTATARLRVKSPAAAGDTAESVVVHAIGHQTTIPVTIRTTIRTNAKGGSFSGVLTGGNGRAGAPGQANFYQFTVPKGAASVHADVHFANDPGDVVTAYLIDPSGQNLGYSTNVTEDSSGNAESTLSVDAYHVKPQAGRWTLALSFDGVNSGNEVAEPFAGTISFAAAPVSSNLPHGSSLASGSTTSFTVKVHNSGSSPEAYFVDPRLSSTVTMPLMNLNGSNVNAESMTLPLKALAGGAIPFPYYFVPSETSQIQENLTTTGSVPVNFDSSYFPGDPDLEGVQSGNSANLTFNNAEVSPGLWSLNPTEVGPFGSTNGTTSTPDTVPPTTAAASFQVTTKAFDSAVTSSTGDAWTAVNEPNGVLSPVLVPAGGTATIKVTIAASGAAGSVHSGTLFVDDLTVAGFNNIFGDPSGDEIAALPYSYKISG
ncbi:MAG TPA: S8 family serine peptidase [Streptosporangiaceae bacterium]